LTAFRIYYIVDLVLDIYFWLLIARIIFPLLRLGRDAHQLLLQLRRLVYLLTEPVLSPIRKRLMPIQLGPGAYLDLSPLVVMLILHLLRSVAYRILL